MSNFSTASEDCVESICFLICVTTNCSSVEDAIFVDGAEVKKCITNLNKFDDKSTTFPTFSVHDLHIYIKLLYLPASFFAK